MVAIINRRQATRIAGSRGTMKVALVVVRENEEDEKNLDNKAKASNETPRPNTRS